MRYVTFSRPDDRTQRCGALIGGRVIDIGALASSVAGGYAVASLRDLIEQGSGAWNWVRDLVAGAAERDEAPGYPVDSVALCAPLPRLRRNVFCVARNYGASEGAAPMFFTKATGTICGPTDDVEWDRQVTGQVDWEIELGIVIGQSGKDIPAARVSEFIFGYTVLNDLTARDLQRHHGQFFKGKSLDSFCPIGPCIVTSDEFGDPLSKAISLRVNGVTKQHDYTRSMITPPDALIESLSSGMTLLPGDLIATGSPPGTGQSRTPPEWLQDGDIVEGEIEGIGVIRNRMIVR
jgi:2-keto-4-pentenoate hydratase/2-oxohepta-3-ene-1,7-dioic acid hydratase in catechol pathway